MTRKPKNLKRQDRTKSANAKRLSIQRRKARKAKSKVRSSL